MLMDSFAIEYLSLSPQKVHIHDFPVEILTEIFLFCVPNDPLNRQQPDTTIPPMLLCQVCSIWRRVAFSIPTIWVYLYYVAKIPLQESRAYELRNCIRPVDIKFLNWWVGNSQATSLIFRFEFNFTGRNGQNRRWGRIWKGMQVDPAVLFFRVLSNASGLYLNDFVCMLLRKRLTHHNLEFPNLRSLANLANSPSATPIGSILHLGSLRHLIYHEPRTMLDNGIFWAYLTHISIRSLFISGTDWCILIRQLEALQVGEFMAIVDTMATDTTTEYYSKDLPHLCELRLLLYFQNINFNPLPNIVLPSLTTLHYDGANMRHIFFRKLFLASPHLTILHLGCASLHEDSLENPFELLMSGWTGWAVWRYALRLEEVIIDYLPSLNCDQLQLHIWWCPPPNLRRLVLVYFTDTHFFERWLFKLEEYLLRISERNTTGIQSMLREEANVDYWRLSPSELREWMEI
jgi:hypothetical protein